MKNSEVDDTFESLLKAHARDPKHARRLETPDLSGKGTNARCGDAVEIEITLSSDGGSVEDAAFTAKACGLCVASASMLCELVHGRLSADLDALAEGLIAGQTTDTNAVWNALLAVLAAYPQRRRCIELPWSALQNALRQPRNQRMISP